MAELKGEIVVPPLWGVSRLSFAIGALMAWHDYVYHSDMLK